MPPPCLPVPGATPYVGESPPDNVLPPKYERELEEAAREQHRQDWDGGVSCKHSGILTVSHKPLQLTRKQAETGIVPLSPLQQTLYEARQAGEDTSEFSLYPIFE